MDIKISNGKHQVKTALPIEKISRRHFLGYMAGLTVGATAIHAARGRARAAITGKRIPELELLAPDWPAAREALNCILPNWEALGLKMRVSFKRFEEAFPRILTHNFGHGACMIWGADEERLDPGFFLREFYHSSRAIKGFWNYGQFQDKAIDQKIDAQDREMDHARRVEKLIALQDSLAEEHVVFPLVHPPVWQVFNVRDWRGYVSCIGAGHTNIWTCLRLNSPAGRDVFRALREGPINDFNPLSASNHGDIAVHRLVYDTFARWGPEGQVVPWAARAWQVVGDDAVDLQIRTGMQFHDGRSVTAEDARFSLEIARSRGSLAFPPAAGEIDRVDVTGEDTVRIRLKRACARFLTVGLCSLVLLPRHIWKEVANPLAWKNDAMTGSGPFRLKSGGPGKEILLEAYRDHWMAPGLPGIRLLPPRNLDEAVEMLRSDEADALEARISRHAVDVLAPIPHLAVRPAPGHGLLEVRGDVSSPPFNDRAFRRALHHAIPREEINRAAFLGNATEARNSFITPRLEQWGSSRVPAVEFDLQKARNILEEAGYGWDLGERLCYPPKGWKAKQGDGKESEHED